MITIRRAYEYYAESEILYSCTGCWVPVQLYLYWLLQASVLYCTGTIVQQVKVAHSSWKAFFDFFAEIAAAGDSEALKLQITAVTFSDRPPLHYIDTFNVKYYLHNHYCIKFPMITITV